MELHAPEPLLAGISSKGTTTANTFVAAFRSVKAAVSNGLAFNRMPVAMASAA